MEEKRAVSLPIASARHRRVRPVQCLASDPDSQQQGPSTSATFLRLEAKDVFETLFLNDLKRTLILDASCAERQLPESARLFESQTAGLACRTIPEAD